MALAASLMSEDPAHYTKKSIWGTPLAQDDGTWSPRKPLGLFNPPLSSYDSLYYRTAPGTPGAPQAPGAPGTPLGAPHGSLTAPSSAASTSSVVDDDLIPTAIVVKNIPFAIKKEQLVDVMTQLGLPLPYAFNYHFDNGVFRGLAFANYATAEETAAVISALNGREIGGRKLRVEYKKMLPLQERERIEREKRERRGQLEEQHASSSSSVVSSPVIEHAQVPQSPGSQGGQAPGGQSGPLSAGSLPQLALPDLNDQDTLDLYTSLVLFSAKPQELAIPRATPLQRQTIYQMCHKLGVQIDDRDGQLVLVSVGRPSYPSTLFP